MPSSSECETGWHAIHAGVNDMITRDIILSQSTIKANVRLSDISLGYIFPHILFELSRMELKQDHLLKASCRGGRGFVRFALSCLPAGCSPTHHPWGSVVKKLKMEMCWCMPARKSQPNCSVPRATQAWQVRNWMKLRNSAGEKESEGVIISGLSLSHCSFFQDDVCGMLKKKEGDFLKKFELKTHIQ